MAWYWYLVIAVVVVVVLLLIAFFGTKKLKNLAYLLVCNAEKLIGSGKGEEKFNLVIKKLSELTKGFISESVLKSIVNWAVDRMKLLLEENSDSTTKHLAEKNSSTTENK